MNSINFKDGWAKGFADLLARFTEDGVPQPKATNFAAVSKIWETVLLSEKKVIEKTETYASNWFPIVRLPDFLYFYKVDDLVRLHDFPLWTCNFPATKHKQYLVAFARHDDFVNVIPQFARFESGRTKVYKVSEVMREGFNDGFIKEENARHIIIQLLNVALNRLFVSRRLRKYIMANKRKAYWIELGALEKDKINKVLMVGKMKFSKERHINWHFGVSGSARIEAENYFVINSHIIFTENGKKLIEEASIQHRCRRKQGKDWWNSHWRDKLMNFMRYFAKDGDLIVMHVGSREEVFVSCCPYDFHCAFGYTDPDEMHLPEETGYIDIVADMDEEIETESEEEEVE